MGERNGRFTGRTFDIPIGEKKVKLLAQSGKSEGATTTGYGDHPTDIPFLRACDRGVLVQAEGHEMKEIPEGLSHRAAAGERVRQTSIPPGEGVVGGRKNLRPWASPGGTFVRVPTLNAPHDTTVSQIYVRI